MPDSGTDCGESAALSTIEMFADSADCVDGVKVTVIVQLRPRPRDAGQLLDSAKSAEFAPASLMLVMERSAFPVLVSVTVCGELDVPCC